MTTGLLSVTAEQQIIDSVVSAVLSGLEQFNMNLSDSPEIMIKKELIEFLNISNASADKYLIAKLPFFRVGSSKRWVKNEILKYLVQHQEVIVKK